MNPAQTKPSQTPSKRSRVLLVLGVVAGVTLLFVVVSYFALRSILGTGITQGPDAMFGDQHLKTTVALIELHKVRHGEYPESLSDLEYIGQWDQIALSSVAYFPNEDRTRYYVEVQRGWIGKPSLEMPDEFWQGTGYSEKLKPQH